MSKIPPTWEEYRDARNREKVQSALDVVRAALENDPDALASLGVIRAATGKKGEELSPKDILILNAAKNAGVESAMREIAEHYRQRNKKIPRENEIYTIVLMAFGEKCPDRYNALCCMQRN